MAVMDLPDVDLPGSLSWRTLRPDDVDAVLAMLDALELRVFGQALADRSDLEPEWGSAAFVAGDDGVGVEDGDGTLVGAAMLGPYGTVELHSQQDEQGLALLPSLLDWCLGRARTRGVDGVSMFIADDDHGRRALAESRGFTVHHLSWVLRLPEHLEVDERDVPQGYAIRPFAMADAPAVHALIEHAFSAWEGRDPHPYEAWAATTVDRDGVDPAWFRVATCGEEVVGACIAFDTDDAETWVHHLAVDDAHRGNGLAQLLLAAAYEAGRGRGNRTGGLSTDSRSGALDLYERLGLRVEHSFASWALDLTAGAAETA